MQRPEKRQPYRLDGNNIVRRDVGVHEQKTMYVQLDAIEIRISETLTHEHYFIRYTAI